MPALPFTAKKFATHKARNKAPIAPPKGYEAAVARLRKKAEEEEPKPPKPRWEGKPKAPSFMSRQKTERPVLLHMEVSVANGKKGLIALRDGDDPDEVTTQHCCRWLASPAHKPTFMIMILLSSS